MSQKPISPFFHNNNFTIDEWDNNFETNTIDLKSDNELKTQFTVNNEMGSTTAKPQVVINPDKNESIPKVKKDSGPSKVTYVTGFAKTIPTVFRSDKTSVGQNIQGKGERPPPTRYTMPNRAAKPMESSRFAYPKGIPRSFYASCNMPQGNLVTMNMRDPYKEIQQNAQQIPVRYTESAPGMEYPAYGNNQVETTPVPQAYSPSQIFTNNSPIDGEVIREGSESPNFSETGKKRLSAFQRLGPIAESKKPKLIINLMVNKEQSVREVVNETEGQQSKEQYTPIHQRKDMLNSTDPTVARYIDLWPWKKKINASKTVTARSSKTVMLLELEQMKEYYSTPDTFTQVTVRDYPSTWTKEDVLDAVLDSVKGCQFKPCFIEFTEQECKFLVLRSRMALIVIHKYGFYIRKDEIVLSISLSIPEITLEDIDFVPNNILNQRLARCYDGESKLDLSQFSIKNDFSYFLYFPLNRGFNQTELTKTQNIVIWSFLVELDLSHNRITSINGFYLPQTMPKLKHLNLSHNLIDRITVLLNCKELALRTIHLEGNPLCSDYRDPDLYVKAIKLIFPCIWEIDGIPVNSTTNWLKNLPAPRKNYCPVDAKDVVEKFLEVFFPLWDVIPEQRGLIENLYEDNARMVVNFTNTLRYGKVYKLFPKIFPRTRASNYYQMDTLDGNLTIVKYSRRWPDLEHDPHTFTVDVIYHSENTTIVKIGGLMKLTSKSLADEEHLLSFTRTVVLRSVSEFEYKIHKEWVLWDDASEEEANTAFQVTTVKTKQIYLNLELKADDEHKEKLTDIFMQLTTMDKVSSQRCLEAKNWNLKHALEYFTKLMKLGSIDCLKE